MTLALQACEMSSIDYTNPGSDDAGVPESKVGVQRLKMWCVRRGNVDTMRRTTWRATAATRLLPPQQAWRTATGYGVKRKDEEADDAKVLVANRNIS